MNMRHMRPLIMLLGAVLVSWLAVSSPVRASVCAVSDGPVHDDAHHLRSWRRRHRHGDLHGRHRRQQRPSDTDGQRLQPGLELHSDPARNDSLFQLQLSAEPSRPQLGSRATPSRARNNFIFNTAQTSNIPLPLTSNLAKPLGGFFGGRARYRLFSLSRPPPARSSWRADLDRAGRGAHVSGRRKRSSAISSPSA